MDKALFSIVLGAVLLVPAQADGPWKKKAKSPIPALTPQEAEAIAIAKRWESNSINSKPIAGENGAIKFVFGAQPNVVCAVLQVTDVALQPGEVVNGINIGDEARWKVEPAITGTAPNEVQHLIIKPVDVGLETSLVVTTNRRTYYLKLRSHKNQHMPQVSFSYPEEAIAKWEAIKAKETLERQEKILPQTGEYLGDLNFDYDVSGSAPWKPIRVYNDGKKTVIQMPDSMAQTEAPTLLVVQKKGGIFSKEETAIVNYRLQNGRYIVDSIFDKAILVAGVGGKQDRVVIDRRK